MNILVVDDEPLIHISIEKLIRSCYPEVNVTHAYNGRTMLEAIEAGQFLMAYVDIKMPGLSGLEALQRAREIAPFTRYYIMTGFDEFEYAKQAIRLRVDDYLMKPLDPATIRETIEASLQYHRQHLDQKKNVFRNWLESTLNNRDSSFCEFTGHYCCLLLVTIDCPDLSPEFIQEPFRGHAEHIVSLLTDEGLLLLAFAEKYDTLRGITRELAGTVFPPGMTCFAGSVTDEPAELRATLKKLSIYAALRVALGINHFYFLTPLLTRSTVELDFCRQSVLWQTAYVKRDYPLFTSQSELLLGQLEKYEEIRHLKENFLVFAGLTLAREDGLPAKLSLLREQLQVAARELLSAPAGNKADGIIEYIREHYRENLSTADLSERFGLSANHISNLIKNTLGIRYNDYVTQLRLNRAKELLVSTHQSIKDITADCGYFSQSHFTKLFLKHEGCTPAEYRKNHTAPAAK